MMSEGLLTGRTSVTSSLAVPSVVVNHSGSIVSFQTWRIRVYSFAASPARPASPAHMSSQPSPSTSTIPRRMQPTQKTRSQLARPTRCAEESTDPRRPVPADPSSAA